MSHIPISTIINDSQINLWQDTYAILGNEPFTEKAAKSLLLEHTMNKNTSTSPGKSGSITIYMYITPKLTFRSLTT
jgi:hypothetical protein